MFITVDFQTCLLVLFGSNWA